MQNTITTFIHFSLMNLVSGPQCFIDWCFCSSNRKLKSSDTRQDMLGISDVVCLLLWDSDPFCPGKETTPCSQETDMTGSYPSTTVFLSLFC